MVDIKDLLDRQSRWQRARAQLSWSEKLRLAEILRSAALIMGRRQGRRTRSSADRPPPE